MDRSTIDFGIDLGTTNSAISVLNGVATDIIKNNQDADITPSVVGIDKRGALRVGRDAKDQMGFDPGNAFGEFKRQMGTEHQYTFKRSGAIKRPEELSAEVLKELRGNVQQRTGESIDAAVITVPAAFELHQCDATRKAAELAGFLQSPLLQEPVAAALAYGFQVDNQRSYWLVYDFGGGTFDAAVIKSEEGTVRVVNHGGDNFLGGSDLDWELINGSIAPRLVQEYGLSDFTRGNPRWQMAFSLLKRSVERAKITLSRNDSAYLDECRFQGADGEFIEPDYELTRSQVAALAEPLIQKSVAICRRVLLEKKLAPSAIEKLILVGGPTLAPYFRDMLAAELRIPLDHTVDPLTVVARGAAVFSGTQRRAISPTKSPKGAFTIDLRHKPVGFDSAPLVGGRISAPSGQAVAGCTIELSCDETKWRSGKLPISTEGIFTATLRAERGKRNVYAITLIDSTGQRQRTSPESFTYTVGAVVDEQPLMNSMGLALSDNAYEVFLEKGRGLPAKVTKTYFSAIELKKGQSGTVVSIPVCEGESVKADRNRMVGALEISGAQISRDLPIHSEIEVTLEIDASRIIKVRAYVPTLDLDFETTLKMLMKARQPAEIRTDVNDEAARLREIADKARNVGDKTAADHLAALEGGPLLAELGSLANAADDADAAAQCERRLIELKIAIDTIADKLEWPELVAQAKERAESLVTLARETGEPQLQTAAEAMARDVAKVIEGGRIDDLRAKIKELDAFYFKILFAQPSFWVYQFQELEKAHETLADKARATRLCDQGRAFVSQNNIDGLRNVVRELWKMMPDEARDEVQRGYRSGLVRGAI